MPKHEDSVTWLLKYQGMTSPGQEIAKETHLQFELQGNIGNKELTIELAGAAQWRSHGLMNMMTMNC